MTKDTFQTNWWQLETTGCNEKLKDTHILKITQLFIHENVVIGKKTKNKKTLIFIPFYLFLFLNISKKDFRVKTDIKQKTNLVVTNLGITHGLQFQAMALYEDI